MTPCCDKTSEICWLQMVVMAMIIIGQRRRLMSFSLSNFSRCATTAVIQSGVRTEPSQHAAAFHVFQEQGRLGSRFGRSCS